MHDGLHQLIGFLMSPFGIWLPLSFVGGAIILAIDYVKYNREN